MKPYIATLLTFAVAVPFLQWMVFFAHPGRIESSLSHKLIHIATR
jgi:hypothetical protein